jgi:hypothetical protein
VTPKCNAREKKQDIPVNKLALHRPVPRPLAVLVASLAALGLAPSARATPRSLPFTYPVHTLPAGTAELEQYIDFVPTRVLREKPDGTVEGVMSHRYVLQTEFEYGITDRLEAAFYLVFRQAAAAGGGLLEFQGTKQRLRYRLLSEADAPFGLTGYFEIATFHDEIEFEEKLIFGRRFGYVELLGSLWVEQEYYFQQKETKLIYNPTLGLTYEFSPHFVAGLEYWVRGRFDKDNAVASSDAPTRTHHYLGPTLLLQGKTMWLSLGAYLGLNAVGKGFEVNAAYGPVWVRALLGVDL